ncbi:MAG: hypothetical protein DRH93_01255 [Deltaproteobacteria bacterium]|nr:MAG: hypothetical protein DRH93_01255 [Deltaproteobacteria bacterium]
MTDKINVDKLKNDAFEAIDALFSEEDEDTSLKEQTLGKTRLLSDEFEMLKEYTLALDWEYSDKELERFKRHLDKIALKHPDKYNQSLVKMLKSIIIYLQKAREKAFPQTLNVMSSVIDSLKIINKKNFDKAQIKFEVSSAYKEIVKLKEKILEYNKKIRKHTSEKNTNVLKRLDQLEEKIIYLEKQNDTLKQLIVDQHQSVAATAFSSYNSNIEKDTGGEFGMNSFSAAQELSPPMEASEPIIVDVDDICLDDASIQPPGKVNMSPHKTNSQEDAAFPPNYREGGEPDKKINGMGTIPLVIPC